MELARMRSQKLYGCLRRSVKTATFKEIDDQDLEVGHIYEMSLFEDMAGYESEEGRPPGLLPIEKSIYDQVIYDSGVERELVEALDGMDEVKLFVKLPGWFIVSTPIGDNNPDWAVVFHVQDEFGETREKLYLVRETKGTRDEEELRRQLARGRKGGASDGGNTR